MSTRSINLIVIHCSATPSGRSIGADPARVIDGWHAARGFRRNPKALNPQTRPHLKHIGYHGVIDVNGRHDFFQGRSFAEVGAHAAQFNAHSLGLCLVGGKEREGRYTAAQWETLARVVMGLAARFGIPLQRARRVAKATSPGYSMVMGICGHRDLSPDKNGTGLVEPFEWLKTCPGFDVGAWLDNGLRPLSQHIFTGDAA